MLNSLTARPPLRGSQVELDPDVILLQEVDEHFMPIDWNPADGSPLPCGSKLEGYTPYRSYNVGTKDKKACGVAVLLKDAVLTRDRSIDTVYLKATEAHGWKTGVVVHAMPVRGATCQSGSKTATAAGYADAAAADDDGLTAPAPPRKKQLLQWHPSPSPSIAFGSLHLRWSSDMPNVPAVTLLTSALAARADGG